MMPKEPPGQLVDLFTRAGYVRTGTRWARLSGGRTNKSWHNLHAGLVLKLYSRRAGNHLFANDPEREADALLRLSGTGLAPRPVAFGWRDVGRWLLYDHVSGADWQIDAAQVARSLAALHQLAGWEALPLQAGGTACLDRQARAMLAQTSGPCERLLISRRPDCQTVSPSSGNSLLHGDPVPGNLICAASGLVFIDWQCPARGDPTQDIALFLSPAMQSIYRGAVLNPTEIQAFLAAYDDSEIVKRYQSLAPWYHWRMAAYCLWQTQRGSVDYAAAIDLELAAMSAAISDIRQAQ